MYGPYGNTQLEACISAVVSFALCTLIRSSSFITGSKYSSHVYHKQKGIMTEALVLQSITEEINRSN